MVVNGRMLYSSSDLNIELPREFFFNHLMWKVKMERKLAMT